MYLGIIDNFLYIRHFENNTCTIANFTCIDSITLEFYTTLNLTFYTIHSHIHNHSDS